MHASTPLLRDVLRERFGLGHDGYIGSDNTNVEGLSAYFHGFASNASDAAAMALAAGVDQDMPGGSYLGLAALVSAGVVPLSNVDRAAGPHPRIDRTLTPAAQPPPSPRLRSPRP